MLVTIQLVSVLSCGVGLRCGVRADYGCINSLPCDFDVITSYGDYNATSAQYKWLAADLKAVDRTKTPWLVASMHAPWYNSNVKHHNEIQETGMRAAME